MEEANRNDKQDATCATVYTGAEGRIKKNLIGWELKSSLDR